MHSGSSAAEKGMFPQFYGYLTDAVHTSHSFYLFESHFGLHHMLYVLPFISILRSDQTCLCNSLSLRCFISPSNPCCYHSSPAPCWWGAALQAETGWLNLTCSLRLTVKHRLLKALCWNILVCRCKAMSTWLPSISKYTMQE